MTTTKSSFSFGRVLPFYRNILRRNRGVGCFYAALIFVFLPLQYILTLYNWRRMDMMATNSYGPSLMGAAHLYNGVSISLFFMLMLILPIIYGANLFGYLHNKRSVDVYHALPLTRDEMFCAHAMAGLTLLWAPLIVNFGIAAVAAAADPRGSAVAVLCELGCWLSVTLVIFAVTVLAAVQLGTAFDTVLYSLELNATPAALYLTYKAMQALFLYGFSDDGSVWTQAYRLSPVSLIIGRQTIAETWHLESLLAENSVALAVWFVIGLLVLAGAMLLYRRRKSESAESVGGMGPLQVIARSVGTLVGGLLLAAFFCLIFEVEIEQEMTILLVIGLSCLVVYFVGDAVLNRGVRQLPKSAPAALITSAVVCALAAGMMFGGYGYEHYLPEAAQVKSATTSRWQSRYADEPLLADDYVDDIVYTDPAAIELLIKAHEAQLADHKAGFEQDDTHYRNYVVEMCYTLTDGKQVQRRYYPAGPSTRIYLRELDMMPETVEQLHAAFYATPEMLTEVQVVNGLGNAGDTLDSLTDAQKQTLLETLRRELREQSAAELENGVRAAGRLTLTLQYTDSDLTEPMQAGETTVTVLVSPGTMGAGTNKYPTATSTYTTQSHVLLTDSFDETRALLLQYGLDPDALQSDFSQVKSAYIGIVREYRARPWLYEFSDDMLHEIDSNIYHGSYEDREYQEKRDSEYLKITGRELQALVGGLADIAPYDANGKGYELVVAIPNEADDKITGYYYLRYESLPEGLRTALRTHLQAYGFDEDYLLWKGIQ